jgi:hypothetical protein
MKKVEKTVKKVTKPKKTVKEPEVAVEEVRDFEVYNGVKIPREDKRGVIM